MAAYETPVSDRMWVLTATGATPAPVLEGLLDHLADGDGWDAAIGAPLDEKMVTAATQPLSDAGWKHTMDGRWIRWPGAASEARRGSPSPDRHACRIRTEARPAQRKPSRCRAPVRDSRERKT